MVSVPRIERKARMKPMRKPREHHGEGRRQHHRPEHLHRRRAHGLGGGHVDLVDVVEPGAGVEHHGEERDGRADRDLRAFVEAEEQHVEREEQDRRDGIEPREERVEHPHREPRQADGVADDAAEARRDGERDHELRSGSRARRARTIRSRSASTNSSQESVRDGSRIGFTQRPRVATCHEEEEGGGAGKKGDHMHIAGVRNSIHVRKP